MGTSNDTSGALLPIRPLSPQMHYISFLTDVLTAYNGVEQRISLRKYPRNTFSIQYRETDEQVANKLKNHFIANPYGTMACPLWMQSTNMTTLPVKGTNDAYFDTSNAFYQVGGFAVIWESKSKYEILEIGTVNSDSLAFSSNIVNSYSQCYIMPSFYMVPRGAKWTEHLNHTSFDFELSTSNQFEVPDYTFAETYFGVGVFPFSCNLFESNSVDVSIINNDHEFDNQTGLFDVQPTFDVSNTVRQYGINVLSRQSAFELIKLINHLKGRQKSIWVPSFNEDLKLTADLDGTNAITVQNDGYLDIFKDRTTYGIREAFNYLAISHSSGTVEYTEVESATENGDEIDLVCSDNLTTDSKENVKIMMLNPSRLASDTIEIEWLDSSNCFTILPFSTCRNALDGIGPGEYALVSTGTQYIDTGITLTISHDFYLEIAIVTAIDSTYIGAYSPNTATDARIVSISGSGTPYGFRVRFGASNYTLENLSNENQYYTIEKRDTSIFFDDIQKFTGISIGTSLLKNLFLFACSDGSQTDGKPPISFIESKILKFMIWSDATRTSYLRNMWAVPAGMTAQGASKPALENCMWDAVSKQYFYNQGTGVFGIESITGVVAGQYALISSGTQYINLGTVLNNRSNLNIDLSCSTAQSGLSNNFWETPNIFGCEIVGGRSDDFGMFISSDGSICFSKGNDSTTSNTRADSGFNNDGLFHDYAIIWDVGTSTFAINGITQTAPIGSSVNTQNGFSVILFATRESGTVPFRSFIGKISNFSAVSSSVALLNMWAVPAGMTAQGASTPAPSNCMYDAVSNTYFENQGTGSFSIEAL